MKPVLLVVEDDENIASQMKWALSDQYEVLLSSNAGLAIDIVKNNKPHLVTLDLGLPPDPDGSTEGLNLLGDILEIDKKIKVVIVSGNSEREVALRAISKGAYDHFGKPIDIDELKYVLKRAHYVFSLEKEYHEMEMALHRSIDGEIIGSSKAMLEAQAIARKVATNDIPVLITGESGTGKEILARYIHQHSRRNKNDLVPLNCGAIPENLMESELFGYEKGAFTGAHTRRQGKFEGADGGTLFLDEIGELPLPLQVKLLRFLQDNKIERVGGKGLIDVDVKIIAATNRVLKEMVSEGLFRDDLYYRLAVITIDLPPLREKKEDVLLLANHFLLKYSHYSNRQKYLSQGAMDSMQTYNWPGNVRELENKIRRAITLSDGIVISSKDLGLGLIKDPEIIYDLATAKQMLEKKYIIEALARHKGIASKVSKELDISRPTLKSFIKKYGIEYNK